VIQITEGSGSKEFGPNICQEPAHGREKRGFMRFRVAGVPVLALLLAAPATAGEASLFAPRPASADAAGVPARVGVMRERLVEVNLSALDFPERAPVPLQHTVLLNLFDGVSLRARIDRIDSLDRGRGRSWVGQLEGEPLSSVVLTSHDGVVTGSAVWPGGAYRIAFDSRGQVVEQLDHSQFPENDCFREAADGEPPADAGADTPAAMTDDGSTIEVLVAYTPAARTAAGGVAGMASLINTAITETNAGYANSQVIQRLHLAGSVELAYTESDISTDLSRITSPSDGFMDVIHALRNTYYADLVVLIGEGYASFPDPNKRACGIAWLMEGDRPTFAPNAFSVVDRTCATGYYSFGHEMGHNMGLNHARVDPVLAGAYSYSYGYKDSSNTFRTVMAYCCGYETGTCSSGCPRILHFSNPNVSYAAKPTGVIETSSSSAHNALSLNNTRVTVANWRVSPAASTLVNRYRLYSDVTKEHHYTTDSNEYVVLGTRGWVQEGVAHKAYTGTTPVSGITPVPLYRLYHAGILQHLWTTDSNEYAVLATRNWTQEGIDGYILPTAISGTTVPLYRLAYAFLPIHLWTTDANENAVLATRGWIQEGVVGHVVP
jgi:hypothetical protein